VTTTVAVVPGCWELTCRSWFDVMSIDSNPTAP
jgi:hypothetical protein